MSPGNVTASQRSLLAAVLGGLLLAGCSKQPAEIEPPPASSGAPAPAVAPLVWDAPTSWTVVDVPKTGPRKASYKVDKVGADKEDATVDVMFFGTGAKGDVQKNFKDWFGQFDGDVGAAAKRESAKTQGGLDAEIVDTPPGTFKVALTPPIGPKKQPPVQMVKEKWRMHAAAVRTPDRGTWFFRMVGPDETVQAARPAFRRMIESAR
jgi:hypothetical protein